MIVSLYLEAARNVLDYLEGTQATSLQSASELVVAALTKGGVVRCAEIGHGLQGDFLNRAGGLAAVQPFTYRFEVDSRLPECLSNRSDEEPLDREIEIVRFALRHSNMQPEDVLIVSSVSGRGKIPIELAISGRERGIKIIGLTSLSYSAEIQSAHPSGMKLCDVVDVVIDIGAPYGDAAVEIVGLDHPALPVSGVGMVCAGWMIWEKVIERMTAAGMPPTVFSSINRPEGPAIHAEACRLYQSRGY